MNLDYICIPLRCHFTLSVIGRLTSPDSEVSLEIQQVAFQDLSLGSIGLLPVPPSLTLLRPNYPLVWLLWHLSLQVLAGSWL